MFILIWWSLESDVIISEALFHLHLFFSLAGIHLSCHITQNWKEMQSWLFPPVYVITSLPLASIGWTKLVGFWGWGGFLWISSFIMCAFHLATIFSIWCLFLVRGGSVVPEFLVCLTRCCLPGAGRKQRQPNPLPPQQLGSLTLHFRAPSLHPLNCHPPYCPHPSSLLGCVHTVLPTEPASLLFSFNQILPFYQLGDPCPPWWFPLVHKVLVSIVCLYLAIMCCHIMYCHRFWFSSFRVS